jgi:hypothetical protein
MRNCAATVMRNAAVPAAVPAASSSPSTQDRRERCGAPTPSSAGPAAPTPPSTQNRRARGRARDSRRSAWAATASIAERRRPGGCPGDVLVAVCAEPRCARTQTTGTLIRPSATFSRSTREKALELESLPTITTNSEQRTTVNEQRSTNNGQRTTNHALRRSTVTEYASTRSSSPASQRRCSRRSGTGSFVSMTFSQRWPQGHSGSLNVIGSKLALKSR